MAVRLRSRNVSPPAMVSAGPASDHRPLSAEVSHTSTVLPDRPPPGCGGHKGSHRVTRGIQSHTGSQNVAHGYIGSHEARRIRHRITQDHMKSHRFTSGYTESCGFTSGRKGSHTVKHRGYDTGSHSVTWGHTRDRRRSHGVTPGHRRSQRVTRYHTGITGMTYREQE